MESKFEENVVEVIAIIAIENFKKFQNIKKENENLKQYIEDRKLIGKAKNILIEKEGISENMHLRNGNKSVFLKRFKNIFFFFRPYNRSDHFHKLPPVFMLIIFMNPLK